jgi:hypothetical protein
MTSDQVKGLARIVLGVIGGYLIAHGVDKTAVGNAISAAVDAVPTLMALVGAVTPVVAGAWSVARHTEVGNAKAAASAPGVKVVVDPVVASVPMIAAANDQSPELAGIVRKTA